MTDFKRKDIINMTTLVTLFMCYTLKFLVSSFYAATDKYFGVIVFIVEGILIINNVNIFTLLKNKDRDTIVIAALLVVIGVNLIVVHSGFGAYFTAANFALIF